MAQGLMLEPPERFATPPENGLFTFFYPTRVGGMRPRKGLLNPSGEGIGTPFWSRAKDP